MKHLRLLAISDTHLGEESSLLTFPAGRQELWKVLGEKFGTYEPDHPGDDGERFEVDELVLLGDIPDRTMSSTSEITTHVNAFIQTLGSAAKVHRCIFVPGNHDHTMWTDYAGLEAGAPWRVTGPAGEPIINAGNPCGPNGCGVEYLTTLFGYPDGASWRAIHDGGSPLGFECVVANPIYATILSGRTYVFTHGTHFRGDVCLPESTKEELKLTHLDKLFELDINPKCEVRGKQTMDELEATVAPFADSLWASPGNNPSGRPNELFYLYGAARGNDPSARPSPPQSDLFTRAQLPGVAANRMQVLTPSGGKPDVSLQRWQAYFMPQMLKYLEDHKQATDEITFVYGDTHTGGWGEMPRDSGSPIRIYNTGAWIVPAVGAHPPCHIFAVQDDGEECVLDFSFKDVSVSGENIVVIAGRTAQYKYGAASWVVRLVEPVLGPILRHYAGSI